jgi:hypothetical protein
MNIRGAKYAANGMIDCEYEHPKYGWIPFAASPDDVEETGREIYALAVAGDVAPMPQPSADEVAAKDRRLKDIADEEAAKSDEKVRAFADMSPDEVRAWIGKNVSTLADAKDVIATLAVAVSVLTRKL